MGAGAKALAEPMRAAERRARSFMVKVQLGSELCTAMVRATRRSEEANSQPNTHKTTGDETGSTNAYLFSA